MKHEVRPPNGAKVPSAALRFIAAMVAVALLIPTAAQPAPTSLVIGRTCWDYKATELLLARLLNQKRFANDVSKLRLDKHLSRVSRKHTSEMIRADALEHTPIATLAERVTNWIELGENIGRSTVSIRNILKAMMDSPVHRANILNPTFTYVGVATERAGGRLWATITFEAREDPGTTLNMPRC